MVEEHDAARSRDELEERLDGLRGEVELPVPAASAVKIDGERAYRLHRRGRDGRDAGAALARSRRSSCSAYDDGVARLDLRVGSGTYIRSIADALGGHCRTLRRLEVGPFSVDDADDERILPPAEALPFLPAVEVDARGGGGDPDRSAAGAARRAHDLRRRAGRRRLGW